MGDKNIRAKRLALVVIAAVLIIAMLLVTNAFATLTSQKVSSDALRTTVVASAEPEASSDSTVYVGDETASEPASVLASSVSEGSDTAAANASTSSTSISSTSATEPSAPATPASSTDTASNATSSEPAVPSTPAKAQITVRIAVNCKNAVAKGYSGSATMLSMQAITLEQGASVYDALRATGLSFRANGGYVTSIEGLAERQYGGGSGWVYYVDDSRPSKGCKDYKLADGDKVAWCYTCDDGDCPTA